MQLSLKKHDASRVASYAPIVNYLCVLFAYYLVCSKHSCSIFIARCSVIVSNFAYNHYSRASTCSI
jgi:hypothetical protein